MGEGRRRAGAVTVVTVCVASELRSDLVIISEYHWVSGAKLCASSPICSKMPEDLRCSPGILTIYYHLHQETS
jgi:hypothetical protein